MIGPAIGLADHDAFARADQRTGGLEEEPGVLDGHRVGRRVVVQRLVVAHFVKVLLIVHRRGDDLARVRDRAEQLQPRQRQRWRVLLNRTRPRRHFREVCNQRIETRQRVPVVRQCLECLRHVPNVRAIDDAEPSF